MTKHRTSWRNYMLERRKDYIIMVKNSNTPFSEKNIDKEGIRNMITNRLI